MKSSLAVALGAAAGGVLRYQLGGYLQARSVSDFPVGTLTVNVLGCLVIGILAHSALVDMNPDLRLLLATGFCGGFTTFSAFSAETMTMLRGGHPGKAATYVALSVVLSLAATFVGFAVADRGWLRSG